MSGQSEETRSSPFPFSGQLIDGHAAARWLVSNLKNLPSDVSICTAFLRSEALEALYPLGQQSTRGRILARWRLGDLLSGASDFGAYRLANRLGFSFYIRQDFHGKVFSIPGCGIVVGSANATLSGFGLRSDSNSEFCTLVPDSDFNQALLDQMFDGAIEMTDSLFEEMTSIAANVAVSTVDAQEWPCELIQRIQRPEFTGRLLLSECLISVPCVDDIGTFSNLDQQDMHLLGIAKICVSQAEIECAFKATKIFRWLVHTLKSCNGKMYFGALTQVLHNTLLDDPVVHRRDVKILLQTLLEWCDLLGGIGVMIDRPGYSQRVRLESCLD
ncbi:hypothetical protein MCEMAEM21_00133 [Oxalobacteraceae bacterium]